MISWQSKGRNAPSGGARFGVGLLVVLALIGGVMSLAQHAGRLHLDGAMAWGPAALIMPLALVIGVSVLRVALTWMAG